MPPAASRRALFAACARRTLSMSRIFLPRSGPIFTVPIDFERYESSAICWSSPNSYSCEACE